MAETADTLQAKIDALETMLARGERACTFADRAVTYKSTDEALKALSYFKYRLAQVTGRSRQSVAVATKGF